LEGFADLGRNEPCPCGSGVKYKRCCLPGEHAFLVSRALGQDLFRVLLVRLQADDVLPAAEAAWRRYWPGDPPRPLSYWLGGAGGDTIGLEDDILPFLDWITHDAPLEGLDAGGGGGADPPSLPDLVAPGAPELSAPAARALAAWRASFLSVFQVLRSDGWRTVALRDLFTDETFTVWDAAVAGPAMPGDVYIARLAPHAEAFELVAATGAFVAEEAEPLRAWGRAELARLREKEADADWRRLWRTRGERLHHYVVDRREHPNVPELLTTTGEAVLMCEVRWRVHGAEDAVTAALDAVREFHRDDAAATAWTWRPLPGDRRWAHRGAQAAPALGDGPSLGLVTLETVAEGNVLTLVCLSEKRLLRGRGLIEDAVGDRIAFLEERRTDPAEAAAALGPSRVADEDADELPAEALDRLREMMLDQERHWVETPLPALNGMTPLQAAESADPEVRRRLDDLLLAFEGHERRLATKGARHTVSMSTERLRARLRRPSP